MFGLTTSLTKSLSCWLTQRTLLSAILLGACVSSFSLCGFARYHHHYSPLHRSALLGGRRLPYTVLATSSKRLLTVSRLHQGDDNDATKAELMEQFGQFVGENKKSLKEQLNDAFLRDNKEVIPLLTDVLDDPSIVLDIESRLEELWYLAKKKKDTEAEATRTNNESAQNESNLEDTDPDFDWGIDFILEKNSEFDTIAVAIRTYGLEKNDCILKVGNNATEIERLKIDMQEIAKQIKPFKYSVTITKGLEDIFEHSYKYFSRSEVEKREFSLEGLTFLRTGMIAKALAPFEKAQAIQPSLEYVQRQPPDAADFFSLSIAADKEYAVVVAGESGSGKTFYSALQAKDAEDFSYIWYTKLDKKVYDKLGREPIGEVKSLDVWREFIDRMLELYRLRNSDINWGIDGSLEMLYSLKTKLNTNRNNWAESVLLEAMKSTSTVPSDRKVFGNWFEGRSSGPKLNGNLIIIIDEATNRIFAEGMVDAVREFCAQFARTRVSGRVKLVLVGTGLDLLRAGGRAVGTDPSKSRVVTMGRPSLEQLASAASKQVNGSSEKDFLYGIEKGTYSRILSSNARMLFHGVIPMVAQKYVTKAVNESGTPLRERLREVGSFRALMDYCPRYYVGSNSLNDLDSETRTHLLNQAFRYHWNCSLQEIGKVRAKENVERHLKSWEKAMEAMGGPAEVAQQDLDDLFEFGLASQTSTSPALKLLACFGLSLPLAPSQGFEFEDLLSYHLVRCVGLGGGKVSQIQLRYAWPESRPRGRAGEDLYDEMTIQTLRSELEEQKKLEKSFPELHEKDIIIFRQASKKAQGPDLLMLQHRQSTWLLDLFQCKHREKLPGHVAENFRTLGVEYESSGKGEGKVTTPTSNYRVRYSETGIEAFREFLSSKLGEEVQLGRRVLATEKTMEELAGFGGTRHP